MVCLQVGNVMLCKRFLFRGISFIAFFAKNLSQILGLYNQILGLYNQIFA